VATRVIFSGKKCALDLGRNSTEKSVWWPFVRTPRL